MKSSELKEMCESVGAEETGPCKHVFCQVGLFIIKKMREGQTKEEVIETLKHFVELYAEQQ